MLAYAGNAHCRALVGGPLTLADVGVIVEQVVAKLEGRKITMPGPKPGDGQPEAQKSPPPRPVSALWGHLVGDGAG